MQAVILAAGISSRFYPFTNFPHKSLINILGKPIIVHTVESVKKSGIKEIILVISKRGEIPKLLGSGKNFGINIKYAIQKEPTGAGNGLLLCERMLKGDFLLLNVSRADFFEYKDLILRKKGKMGKAVLLARGQKNLQKYGVMKVRGDRVLDLVEKPEKGKEPSDLRLIGIYFFSKDFLKTLRKTPDEHYRLEKAISNFAKNELVKFAETDKDAPSLKYPWDLLEMKNFLLNNVQNSIGKNTKIAKSAEVIGNVVIEDGVEIMEGAKIKGPCFIGGNSTVGNNVILRNFSDIEENCVIGANMEIKNSLIMAGSKTHSGYIGDSIIGRNCRIGADFSTANVRLDREEIRAKINEKEVETGLKYLGVLAGDNVKIGIKVSTMPGVSIGQNSIVGPSTVVLKNIAEDTRYYTKFQEIVEKK